MRNIRMKDSVYFAWGNEFKNKLKKKVQTMFRVTEERKKGSNLDVINLAEKWQ